MYSKSPHLWKIPGCMPCCTESNNNEKELVEGYHLEYAFNSDQLGFAGDS